MFNNTFTRTIREMLPALGWWSLGIFILNFWIVTFFPAISASDNMMQMMEQLPESMLEMFGDMATINTLEGFLTVELMSMFLPLLYIVFTVAFGGRLLSREEDDGTLDLLLSYPVPRWRVVLEKFAALVVFTALISLVGYLGLLAGVVFADVDASNAYLFEGMLNLLPMTIFFGALALCLTALKRGSGLAVGVSAGYAGVSYLTFALKSSAGLPDWTQYLSPWYYYGYSTVLADGIEWGGFVFLVAMIVLLVGVGTWGFTQRDLGT